MFNDEALILKRVQRELWQRVLPRVHRDVQPLQIEAWHVPGEPVTYTDAVAQPFEPFAVGTSWGPAWSTTWFKLSGTLPESWAGANAELVIDLGFRGSGAGFQAEGLVWVDGVPLQGVHPRRTSVPIPHVPSGPFTVYIEAAANPSIGATHAPTPMGSRDTAPRSPLYRLARADIAVVDPEVYGLTLDIEVLLGLATALPIGDPRRARLIRQLAAALDALGNDVGAQAHIARALLEPALALPARRSSLQVIGVGHAHIDSAWLWPIRETIRKCARTFASATTLMEAEPSYRFVCSQAAQYEWMEQRYPAIFERITERVATGQFVPVGGMWVEADMNLPSGESILRQMVHGQRYFESRFGQRCNEVWIPDVFGYPGSLPQIFAAGGCTRFITQKLSWNKQNRFPHNTFWWEGIDGTRVLTHFPPVDTYNADVNPAEMVFSERNFQDAGWSDWALMPYGYGNGGGGPTREMVERAARMADLDGAPRLTLGTPGEFFDQLEGEIANGAPVPVWRGELYFEMHRGTLTSQLRTKLGNRRCERLLREAELWLAAAGSALPDEIDRLWKDTLLQQFHDILPGSSIAWVHADAEAEHERIADRLEQIIAAALAACGASDGWIANATQHDRREVMMIAGTTALVAASAFSVTSAIAVQATAKVVATPNGFTNGLIDARWNEHGDLVSLVDVASGREVLRQDAVVRAEIAVDHPVEYDAWDVESWTTALAQPVGDVFAAVFDLDESGLRAAVVSLRTFGRSRLTTSYVMAAESARLDVRLDIDWHEDEQLMSLVIPLDIRADEATCGIQFGNVRRPTHPSSPWDAAKFEVCAHEYVDVSEPSFGVAVLNDGRYGHRLFDGDVRVTLARAAKYPDPTADHGHHRATISILPHGPGLHDVLRHAELLNNPLRTVQGDGVAPAGEDGRTALLRLDDPGVRISAVKPADDGSGDLIVRLHEACGDRAQATLTFGRTYHSAARCNALEEPFAPVPFADGPLSVDLKPFELVTLRLSNWNEETLPVEDLGLTPAKMDRSLTTGRPRRRSVSWNFEDFD